MSQKAFRTRTRPKPKACDKKPFDIGHLVEVKVNGRLIKQWSGWANRRALG